jgi:NAD(P)-dependent dehydrogenase (short-subunit alcohol dehydrogenase family)
MTALCTANTTTQNKVAWSPGSVIVTGAASGIGRATAELLLAEGWRVLALDRHAGGLDTLQQATGLASNLTTCALDLKNIDEIHRVVSGLDDAVPLRGLVCCAAVAENVPFLEVDLNALRSLYEINFMATFSLCQAAARQMVNNGGGSIVNVSSVSGLRANAGRTAYGSSKAALEMLSKIMAVELAHRKIRVNTVAPGPIMTAMAASIHADGESQRLLRTVPQGRYGAAEDIAQGIAYLLDERRSSYVTGHTLCVDGGMYAAGSFESNLANA